MPDPKVLRSILERCAEPRIAAPQNDGNRRALDDVTCTLCVMTATSSVVEALERADALLEEAAAAGRVTPPATAGSRPGPSQEAAPPRDGSGVTLVA
ncbi:DUF5133 domain-containing protein [Streptomyces sp. HNM0645]|uniref:DUF5133 domain-containing protein n=1 Tax=Streptomyces sp. HNM0645 TaxID=2782343 RepID=UPI0024B673AD|nr:DUF5133 domain-containing protein [Streptomyces sp. HNM0645]MDI9884436.1 DUF5133 domain-containing protein [Streptomyces sp. HNM0645]